jgi:hypothetical protein
MSKSIKFPIAIDGEMTDVEAQTVLSKFFERLKGYTTNTISGVMRAVRKDGTVDWFGIVAQKKGREVEAYIAKRDSQEEAMKARAAAVSDAGITDVKPDVVLDDGTIVPAGKGSA